MESWFHVDHQYAKGSVKYYKVSQQLNKWFNGLFRVINS